MDLFKLRGDIDKKTGTIVGLIGLAILLVLWGSITGLGLIPKQLLPAPWKVLGAFGELHFKDALVRNLSYSVYLNVMGYVEAIVISLFVGFLLGLIPLFRGLFSGYLNAARFIPLPAVTGLFIAWFGIESNMKIQFLACGIIVYLIPVVMQRVLEIDSVYEHTAIMLGATPWQRITRVYAPYVMTKITDDIRVLVAISWTYIIVAEMINSSSGGVGALAYLCARQSRVDKVFAVLIVIVMVGFVQDRIFQFIDRKMYPFKYL